MDRDVAPGEDLVAQVGRELEELRRAGDQLDEAVALQFGLNRTDLRCLGILYRRGRVTAGELAEESGLTPGAITTVLDRLERELSRFIPNSDIGRINGLAPGDSTHVGAAAWLRLGARPPTTLALAAAVVCLLDPWAVIAPGFWLSFGAVAAIMFTVGGRSGSGEPGWRARLREAGRVQRWRSRWRCCR